MESATGSLSHQIERYGFASMCTQRYSYSHQYQLEVSVLVDIAAGGDALTRIPSSALRIWFFFSNLLRSMNCVHDIFRLFFFLTFIPFSLYRQFTIAGSQYRMLRVLTSASRMMPPPPSPPPIMANSYSVTRTKTTLTTSAQRETETETEKKATATAPDKNRRRMLLLFLC